MMRKNLLAASALLALVLALAACGGNGATSDNTNTPANGGNTNVEAGAENVQELKIIAENFKFDQEEYTINAGQPVTISVENVQGMHAIAISNTNYKINQGNPQTVTFDQPGTYEIICSIPCGTGHAQMVSTLIVV